MLTETAKQNHQKETSTRGGKKIHFAFSQEASAVPMGKVRRPPCPALLCPGTWELGRGLPSHPPVGTQDTAPAGEGPNWGVFSEVGR